MPTACFYNFSDYEFIGTWGNEDMKFAPKEKRYMPAFLAQHFAKHLVNRELHRVGLDSATSPKAPEDVPEFNKLFRIAYIRERDVPGKKKSTLQDLVDSIDKNYHEVKAEIVPAPNAPSSLPPDKSSVLETREVNEKEDPDYDPEKNKDLDVGKPGAKEPKVVLPPDFNDEDDGDYDGVPVAPKTPGMIVTS